MLLSFILPSSPIPFREFDIKISCTVYMLDIDLTVLLYLQNKSTLEKYCLMCTLNDEIFFQRVTRELVSNMIFLWIRNPFIANLTYKFESLLIHMLYVFTSLRTNCFFFIQRNTFPFPMQYKYHYYMKIIHMRSVYDIYYVYVWVKSEYIAHSVARTIV